MATSSAMHNEAVASGAKVDMKFEVVVIPVADVHRSTVARTPVTAATFPLLLSATQMATPGCSRRSQRACPDVDSAVWTSRR
jgi:hypothetical protein